jgi:hypothetical protein
MISGRISVILGLAFGLVACDVFATGEGSRKNKEIVDPVSKAPGQEQGGPQDLDVARPAFQAKSAAQLARSIEACVGGAAIWVSKEMVVSPTNTSGFLTSDFAEGDDIVEVQKLLFDGTPESLRTGVRVDQISLEYVTALKNVANVVGARCAAFITADNEMCACETDPQATAMLTRCLAAVADPTTPEFAGLAREFGAACKESRGKAIASMIASLAFAKVP